MSETYDKQVHNEAHMNRVGKRIADALGLKQDKLGRYYTAWGTKTELGLYRIIDRIMKED